MVAGRAGRHNPGHGRAWPRGLPSWLLPLAHCPAQQAPRWSQHQPSNRTNQTGGLHGAPCVASPHHQAATRESGLARHLRGIRRITISLPGTVLLENTAADLEDGASLIDGVPALLRAVLQHCEVFLLCRVESDVGEAAVRGALEATGVCGMAKGQVAPHRLLFCGTQIGLTSLVRQLEPDLHVDGDAAIVNDLQRFLPRLLLVGGAGVGQGNVGCVASLQEAWGSV